MVKGGESTRAAPTIGLPAGTRLGKYELAQRLAIGGMAEIYLSRSAGIRGFEKYAVLKRILPQYAKSDLFVQMFLDEARLAATLQHANVVHVYDFGEADGSYFIIMEYVHGEDVRRILKAGIAKKRRLPLENALAIVAGAAAGLHHAHEQVDESGEPVNLVHRDVSPSNILVGFDGIVKVTDFGIAKVRTTGATTTGSLKGKLAYMSPEQVRSEPLDRRSDVFALGIVLWELTTGRRLFAAETEYGIVRKIADQDAPAPHEVSPGYPPELERIVLRALARDRTARYTTAFELQADLGRFAASNGLTITPASLTETMLALFGKRELPWRFRAKSLPEIEIDTDEPSAPPADPVPARSRRALYAALTLLATSALAVGLWPWRHVQTPVASPPPPPAVPEPEPTPEPTPEPPPAPPTPPTESAIQIPVPDPVPHPPPKKHTKRPRPPPSPSITPAERDTNAPFLPK